MRLTSRCRDTRYISIQRQKTCALVVKRLAPAFLAHCLTADSTRQCAANVPPRSVQMIEEERCSAGCVWRACSRLPHPSVRPVVCYAVLQRGLQGVMVWACANVLLRSRLSESHAPAPIQSIPFSAFVSVLSLSAFMLSIAPCNLPQLLYAGNSLAYNGPGRSSMSCWIVTKRSPRARRAVIMVGSAAIV